MPGYRLFYFTSTGNSLWVARELAKELGSAQLTDLVPEVDTPDLDAEAIGIVFPVHMWGLPKRIIKFVGRLPRNAKNYFFAVAVNARQPAASLLQLKKLMAQRGLTLSLGYSVIMPSNYLPWGGPGPSAKIERLFAAARAKVPVMAQAIGSRSRLAPDKGPWWQNLLYSKVLYPPSSWYAPQMDRSFWTDGKCNGCALCARICPAQNIKMRGGKPTWRHRCEQCMTCIQWCPQEAIQHGKNTPHYPRYHHPEVKVADLHHWPVKQVVGGQGPASSGEVKS